MDEEQNQEEQQKNAIAEAGKQIAKDTARNEAKIAAKTAAQAIAKKVLGKYVVIALLVVIVVVLLLLAIWYAVTSIFSQEVSDKAASEIKSYVTIGDNGPEFTPSELIKMVDEYIEANGIDKKELYLGNEKQTDVYLCKYMLASLSTQLPYIKNSTAQTIGDILGTLTPWDNIFETFFAQQLPQQVQGIVKIKRQTESGKKELEYKNYDDFTKLIEEDNKNKEKKSLEYFSIDDSWMLCVSRYIDTIDPKTGTVISSSVTEVKIPYQRMISQYSIPFNFLLTLQQSTQNAEYVSKVCDMIEDGEIELTIYDEISTITTEHTTGYTLNSQCLEEVTPTQQTPSANPETGEPAPTETPSTPSGQAPADPNTTPETGDATPTTELKSSSDTITEETASKTKTNTLKANVTKANVWVIKQTTEYEKKETTDYPLGENGTRQELDDEPEPADPTEVGNTVTWKTDQYTWDKETVEKTEWSLKETKTSINASKFLGLWKNKSGKYQKSGDGAKYKPKGKLVYYQIPNSLASNSPIEMIYSNEEVLYENLERNELTQTHAQIMKYLVEVFKTRKKISDAEDIVDLDLDLSIFEPDEFNSVTGMSGMGGIGASYASLNITDDDIELLCRITAAERGGGTEEQQGYVTSVILNRVLCSGFPNTIKDVIFAPGQFSPIADGRFYTISISDTTRAAVANVLANGDTTGGATFFCTPAAAAKKPGEWGGRLKFLFNDANPGDISSHNFYTREQDQAELEQYAAQNATSGGSVIESAARIHTFIENNGYKYAQIGVTIPDGVKSGRTIDCSSYVSWVLYEAGFSQFAGDQQTSSSFNSNPWGWQQINSINSAKAGDILIYPSHVEIYAGTVSNDRAQVYNCGGPSSVSNPAPSRSGYSTGSIIKILRPPQ